MREFNDEEEGILIHIRRIVPNQYPGAKRPFADPPIEIIEREDSLNLFRCFGLNPRGWVWDSDFARHIFSRHGRGYYSALFWKDGMQGFNAFFRVKCFENGFIREKYYKPKETQDNFNNDEDREDDEETNQDIIYTKDGQIYHKNKHRGCHPYLKSLRIGELHGYYERGEEQAQDNEKSYDRDTQEQPSRQPHYHEGSSEPCYMDHSHDWHPEGED
jgi:hypothetical protein